MKRILSIQIGGVIIPIEDDAYKVLKNYLEDLRSHFAADAAAGEIVRDIEVSITEKYEQLKKYTGQALQYEHVQEIIKQLGSVDDLTQDDALGRETKKSSESKKRVHLYRDTDEAILGGVAAGLGYYLGIDTVFVRIIFIILVFMSGFGVLAYGVLWLVVPAAKSASQKLEMRGNSVDIQAIKKSLQHTLDAIEVEDALPQKETLKKFVQLPLQLFSLIFKSLKKSMPLLRRLVGLFFIAVSTLVILTVSVAASIVIFGDFALELEPKKAALYTELTQGFSIMGLVAAIYIVIVLPFLAFLAGGLALLFSKRLFRAWAILLGIVLWTASMAYIGVQTVHVAPRVEQAMSLFGEQVVTDREPVNIQILIGNDEPLIIKNIPFGTDPALVGGDAEPGSPLDNVKIMAVGTEPFWSFEYSQGTLTWRAPAMDEVGDIVEERHDVGFARLGDSMNLWGIGESELSATVVREPCSDGMSDRDYTHKVEIEHGGREYGGCATVIAVE